MAALLVKPDCLLQRQIRNKFLPQLIGGEDKPSIGVGLAGIGGIPQGLLSGPSEAVVAGPAGIRLASEVQHDVVHRLSDRRVVCQGFVPEAGGISIGQFLPDGLEVFSRVGKLLLFAAGVGHPAHRMTLLANVLLAKVIAVEIPLIISGPGRTAEAEAVVFCFCDVPIDLFILCDGASVFPAVCVHGGQVFQWTILPYGVYKHLQDLLEFRCIELIPVVGPPSVVEAFSAGAKVHAKVANSPQRLILLLV